MENLTQLFSFSLCLFLLALSFLWTAASRGWGSEGSHTPQTTQKSQQMRHMVAKEPSRTATSRSMVHFIWLYAPYGRRLRPVKRSMNVFYRQCVQHATIKQRVWIQIWANCRRAIWMISKPQTGLRNKNKKGYSLIFAARGDALLLFLGCESVIIRVCQKARTDRLCFYSLFATKDRVARWPDADLHFWKTLKFTGLRTFSFNNPTRFHRITNKKLDRIVVCRMDHPPLFSTEKEIYTVFVHIYVYYVYICGFPVLGYDDRKRRWELWCKWPKHLNDFDHIIPDVVFAMWMVSGGKSTFIFSHFPSSLKS